MIIYMVIMYVCVFICIYNMYVYICVCVCVFCIIYYVFLCHILYLIYMYLQMQHSVSYTVHGCFPWDNTDCGTLISVPDDLGNLWTIVVVQAVDVVHDTCPVHEFLELGVSKNWGSLKWMAYNGKSY